MTNIVYVDGSNKWLIVLVSKAANIVSKYTSFIGVDRETRVPLESVSTTHLKKSIQENLFICLLHVTFSITRNTESRS